MNLLSRYERFLYRRIRDTGKHHSAGELRFQLLVTWIPLLLVLAVSGLGLMSDYVRTIAAILAGLFMLIWIAFILRVFWRVTWTQIDAEPVVRGSDD